ncbi:hypothetical protein DENSPDRAFT_279041 [Dentipellis sp. KUC8613]|nr:hypothetical protein DENSPDRAFT_279041 [Dentipellis sp. KUC8613]
MTRDSKTHYSQLGNAIPRSGVAAGARHVVLLTLVYLVLLPDSPICMAYISKMGSPIS